jgi:hypothetical protein
MKKSIVLSILFIVQGCTISCSEKIDAKEFRALISEPSLQTTKQLKAAIALLLTQKDVVIANDAFTVNSQLAFETHEQKDLAGKNHLSGRNLQLPNVIQLVKKGDGCFVKSIQKNKAIEVINIKCTKA